MASPRRSALVLLILLLYWTTSSVQSHDPTSLDLASLYRVKRDLPPGTRDQTEKTLNAAKETLSLIKEIDPKKLSDLIKGLGSIASMAPGIGAVVFAIINMVLAFIPQDDPVLNELRVGFAELNRKLDSLSIQISNLATDVEWFNYASVYSQDEVRILNTWKKFNEFRKNSELIQREEDKLRLAEIFTNYYENTGAEASVANLYHYLTVSSTSLSGNLNDLLRKKFKCGVVEISRYNLYFSSLLWKGMVLNQLYWNLIGFNPAGKQAEQTQMFKNVYEAQISAVESCLKNYEQYMKEDVVEITKALSPHNKQAVAAKVKNALDEKYNWYNWVVLVYDTDQDGKYITFDMTKIPMEKITVAVGGTLKGFKRLEDHLIPLIKKRATDCSRDKQCNDIANEMAKCYLSRDLLIPGDVDVSTVNTFTKVMYVSCLETHSSEPEPFHKVQCGRSYWESCYTHFYYSHKDVCSNTCSNGGNCKVLLNSNEWFCECPDGYYGDQCEVMMDIPTIDIPVPKILSTSSKLKMMESKLEEVLTAVNSRC